MTCAIWWELRRRGWEVGQMADYWEVRREGAVVSHGPKETMPNAQERKTLREGGHKVYVEGKLYREGKA